MKKQPKTNQILPIFESELKTMMMMIQRVNLCICVNAVQLPPSLTMYSGSFVLIFVASNQFFMNCHSYESHNKIA